MSFQINVDLRSRRVGRFVAAVVGALRGAFAQEAERNGLTQAKVAETLGVDRSVINRRLNGESNLTLRSIAELAYAMGDKEIVFEIRDRQAQPKFTSIETPSTCYLRASGNGIKVSVV